MLGWISGCDTGAAREELRAKWILIEGKFPWCNGENLGVPGVYRLLDYENPWADLPNIPWLTEIYHQGITTAWRIENATNLSVFQEVQ